MTPLHTHLAPTVSSIVSGSHFVRRDARGEVTFDTRAEPAADLPRVRFSPTTPRHTIENTDQDDMRIVGVELKP